MKKKIMAIISSLLCLIMLTACGSNDKGTARDASFGEKRDLKVLLSQNFSGYTTSDKKIPLSESEVYKLYKKLSESSSVYMGLEFLGANQMTYFAIKDDNYSMRMEIGERFMALYYDGNSFVTYGSDIEQIIRYKNYPSDIAKSSFPYEMMLGEYFPLFDNADADVYVFQVDIDGESYKYEYYSDIATGYCFDKDGYLCRMSSKYREVLVHDFTVNVPDNAFVQPEGYTVEEKEYSAE